MIDCSASLSPASQNVSQFSPAFVTAFVDDETKPTGTLIAVQWSTSFGPPSGDLTIENRVSKQFVFAPPNQTGTQAIHAEFSSPSGGVCHADCQVIRT